MQILGLLCIVCFFIGFHVHICNAVAICKPAIYTKAKANRFESNLNIVLNNLVNHINSSSNGFNTSVSGQSPDTAYGLLQCRGDATVDECYHCSQEANITIRHDCGNATGGRLMLESCFMRYENYSFVGKLDTQTKVSYTIWNATYPEVYTIALKGLFTNLTKEVYISANRYASGSTTDSSFQKIFALVQCWRDITSIDDCTTCLSIATSSLLNMTVIDGSTHVAGVGLVGSCIARYDSRPFFNSAPPPLPLQLPSPRTQTPLFSPPIPKKSSNKLAIVLGILGGFLVILLLCMFEIQRKMKSTGKSIVLVKENRGTHGGSLIGQDEQTIL